MQVIKGVNFILTSAEGFFGGLYKTPQTGRCFLNTFTPCNLYKSELQFLLYNA